MLILFSCYLLAGLRIGGAKAGALDEMKGDFLVATDDRKEDCELV